MTFIKYIPLLLLLFFLLKFLISFINNSTILLKKNLEISKIQSGMISIKDLLKNNYDMFIKIIETYLNTHDYENISLLPNGNSELTNFTAYLNKESIFISCIQSDLNDNSTNDDNLSLVNISDIECFISRVFCNNCKKGVLITNSTFSKDSIELINCLNSKDLQIEIKLIDGYELTKSIRNYSNYFSREGISYEH